MKVTAVELAVLEHLVVVTVKTDEGLEGHGFALKSAIRIDAEGYVSPPDAPGLGVELDWDVLDKHIVARL